MQFIQIGINTIDNAPFFLLKMEENFWMRATSHLFIFLYFLYFLFKKKIEYFLSGGLIFKHVVIYFFCISNFI
ncbi:hypothetical protein AN642_01155 [Epulopiscium sp. SCG-B10WGA-EpuloA2]|nr:hypothetical protein AN642_01155 [Epulopiscium sp. SCG-B10WGA-EpuloA2]